MPKLVTGLFALAGPIALQNLVGSALNLADNVMIGSLGAASIAGVALANQIFFLLLLFLFAIGSGTAIFTAQFWGKGDLAAIRRFLGLSVAVMSAGALLFFAAAQLFPEQILSLFSTDPQVIHQGGQFLHFVSFGFLFQAVTLSFVNVLRSMEKVRLPLVASVLSLALNTFLNWVFIFGNLGCPAWGVAGSALATVVSRFVEMAVILLGIYRHRRGKTRHPLAARLKELKFRPEERRQFFKVTWPVVGNEVGWALGFTIPALVFARLSTDAMAAYNIADTAIKLVLVVFFGTTNANAIMVGKSIGENNPIEARAIARFFSFLAPALGATLGLLLAASSIFVPLAFHVDETVRSWARTGMLLFALDMPLRMFNWHVIVGILRAGGDTTYSMVLDVGGTWLVGVPLCLLAGLVFHLPFWMVYTATLLEDIPKVFMGLARLKSGKWLNNLTYEPEAA